MICPKCGEENKNDALECSLCHEKFFQGPLKDCFGNEISSSPLVPETPKQVSSLGTLFRFLVGVAVGSGIVGGGIYAYNALGKNEKNKDVECIRTERTYDGECNWHFVEYANYECKDGTKFRGVKCRYGLAFGCDWHPGTVYHSCAAFEKKSNLPSDKMR